MNSRSSGRIDEIPRIVDQLKRAFEGEAWHGPSVLEALAGVNAKIAAARPIPAAHSIWEIVEHVRAWEDAIRHRLNGRALQLSPEQDWPAVSDFGDAAWTKSIDTLKQHHSDLCGAISAMPEHRLLATVPGKGTTSTICCTERCNMRSTTPAKSRCSRKRESELTSRHCSSNLRGSAHLALIGQTI